MNTAIAELSADTPARKSILDLSGDEARAFLLKPESYCSLDLPPYIVFGDLIDGVNTVLPSGDQQARSAEITDTPGNVFGSTYAMDVISAVDVETKFHFYEEPSWSVSLSIPSC